MVLDAASARRPYGTPRLGIVAYWKGYHRKRYLQAVQLAEDLGFESFWVPEAWGYDVFPLLTEMARVTKRIRLATGIVNTFSRSPGLLAMTAATMHELSEGRFILGVGTSSPNVVEGFHGREFRRPLTQTKDVLRVVKGLLGGLSLDECGAELQPYRPFKLAVPNLPVHVPIYVAALKRNAIESVGELADGWLPAFWPHQDLHRPLAWLRAGALRAGRQPEELDVALVTAAIPLRLPAAENTAREILAFYVGGMGEYYRTMLAEAGFGAACEEIDRLYRDKATRGQAKHAVPREMIEALTVFGDPLECRSQLAQRRDLGVGVPLLGLPSDLPWMALKSYLHAVAPSRRPSGFQLAATGIARGLKHLL
jgi:alkanesulfonate monooxygenase SsuD/methylene tetrahydromethanopterin reductase-like flavin-dependent oxidoreductase (luciferase family)